VRLVGEPAHRLLFLEERSPALDPAVLAPLELTHRQSEVLALVAGGKSNEEIAAALDTRPATVAKHLEHIYQKHGVSTRTAAAVRALSLAGGGPPAEPV
jgi:DNA-binding NarL/FixJ family response regulator